MREGEGRTIQKQHQFMNRFFHGNGNKSPSQIQMLAEGMSPYNNLYDVKTVSVITHKKSSSRSTQSQPMLYLKHNLSRTPERSYYVGHEITHDDLEKKHRTGPSLINGRQLTDMAKRGMKDYRKALAFTKKKWDLKTNSPIESGTTVDDVIEYVRRSMYLSNHVAIDFENDEVIESRRVDKEKNDQSQITVEDENKDDDTIDINVDVARGTTNNNDDNDYEENVKKRKKSKNDDDSDYDDDDDNDDEDTDSELDSDLDRKPSVKRKHIVRKASNLKEIVDHNPNNNDTSDEDDYVPDNWMFNSYMAYVLWGPFAEDNKKLSLFLLGKYGSCLLF
jgi:hypothetical protein